MNGSQRFAIASVGLFMLGVGVAVHHDGARQAKAMTGADIVPVRDEMMPVANPGAPMSLTATDGSGLKMVKIWGRAVVADPLAFTELHLEFENPRGQTIEGQFSITLPPGSTVSRFAMKLPSGWQEGEMVEKQAARRAYEDFLHRRQDPALLEQAAGNAFSARVFPIPANGTKELIVSYTQELKGWAPYVLPLRGLPEIGSVDLAVTLEGSSAPAKTLVTQKLSPTEDFGLPPGSVKPTPGLRSDNLVLARIRPVPTETPDPIRSAAILVDTSASRALGFAQQTEIVWNLVHDIAEHAGPSTPITIAAFDQKTDVVFDGKASDFNDGVLAAIRERGAFGASNLEAALAWAKSAKRERLIVITDGIPTAGKTEADAIGKSATELHDAVQRIDAIAVGGIRDEALLRHLTVAGLPRDGAVLDGQLTIASMSRRLNAGTHSGMKVAFEGARWSFPDTLDGVQAGDERFVYADVPENRPVRATIDGTTINLDLQHVDRPLLERAWVQSKIESILEKERTNGAKADTTKEIIDLSVRHRVMSPYTALLVLETDQDYARFKIDRNALADILVVDNGALARMHRSGIPDLEKEIEAKQTVHPTPTATTTAARGNTWGDDIGDTVGPSDAPPVNDPASRALQPAPMATTAMPPPAADSLREAQEFGMIGRLDQAASGGGAGNGQGFGTGHGRLGGAHSVSSPTLQQEGVTVTGSLPTEVVQRIVRQNFGRFRLCYLNGLRTNANLQGRVSTRFTIATDGSVKDIRDGGSDLPDQAVTACVRRGFENLSFPTSPSTVAVVFPIRFSPGDGAMPQNGPPAFEKPISSEPYTGKFQNVMSKLGSGATQQALDDARAWNKEEPGDVLALVALGEAYEMKKDLGNAERAYGSLIDLFPARADMRRFAGVRLERIAESAALDLAVDTFEKAETQRPDHPESHRLVAFAHLKKGEHEKAFEAGVRGVKQTYPPGRFLGVDQILREDLGLIGAAWIHAEPSRKDEILQKVRDAGGAIEDAPSLRFVLDWETDANDVDFHIFDDQGGHAFYSAKHLPSGGDLYADVTTGYGPECFTIRSPKEKRARQYTLQANYYSRGPMGYGMGKLEILDHDGNGNITFQERPFVVMLDHAFVNLGTVTREK